MIDNEDKIGYSEYSVVSFGRFFPFSPDGSVPVFLEFLSRSALPRETNSGELFFL
jgi:hypothetical protein